MNLMKVSENGHEGGTPFVLWLLCYIILELMKRYNITDLR